MNPQQSFLWCQFQLFGVLLGAFAVSNGTSYWAVNGSLSMGSFVAINVSNWSWYRYPMFSFVWYPCAMSSQCAMSSFGAWLASDWWASDWRYYFYFYVRFCAFENNFFFSNTQIPLFQCSDSSGMGKISLVCMPKAFVVAVLCQVKDTNVCGNGAYYVSVRNTNLCGNGACLCVGLFLFSFFVTSVSRLPILLCVVIRSVVRARRIQSGVGKGKDCVKRCPKRCIKAV